MNFADLLTEPNYFRNESKLYPPKTNFKEEHFALQGTLYIFSQNVLH